MKYSKKQRHRRWQDPRLSEERERVALELIVAGASYANVAEALDITEGSAWRVVSRALAKRAEQVESRTVAQARALFLERIELIITKWMPYATGDAHPDGVPNKDAADIIFKALDRAGRILGVETAPRVEVNQTTIVAVDTIRQQVMASLEEVAERQQIIEGTLA